MHVLHVIDSLQGGGAESSLAAMAPGLVERGVRLDVVALTPRPGVRGALEQAGATVTELSGTRRTWWRDVRGIVRERRPDLVHTTLFEADLAGRVGARLARTPVVSTLANDAYGPSHRDELGGHRARLLGAQFADATTAHLAVRLHALTVHVADVMARRLWYPRHRIDVIPRGRDPEVLGRRSIERRDRARAQLGIAPDAPVLLTVARQEPQKGLDVLLDAVPRILGALPSARLLIAGKPGNATPLLQARLGGAAHAGAVAFLGARDDVAELLCAADVFVLPSRREGLGGALLEAMALECPAVLSDIPAFREVADESMAALVPPEDAGALADAVVAAIIDPEATRRRAAAAYGRFLDEYTIDRVVDRMVGFYRGALGG